MSSTVRGQFSSGKSLWRSLMNERVRRLAVEGPLLDLGAGQVGTSSYHELIPHFTTIDVFSVDLMLDKRPTTVADIEYGVPFADDVFGTCLAFNLFEHLYDIQRLLKDIWRVLSPRGRLFFAVPFLLRVHADPYDYSRYTGQSLQRSLEEVGFVETLIEPCGAGAVTAALAQVDFLMPNVFRSVALRTAMSFDRQITKRSAGSYRNARDYPIGYFGSARKPQADIEPATPSSARSLRG